MVKRPPFLKHIDKKSRLKPIKGIYATIGKWWVNGAKLYTDVWDHKPPGIFLIFGASYLFEKFTSVNILFWAKLTATISVLLTQILLFKITSCIE